MHSHSKIYSEDTGEGHIFIAPWAYNSITQGTWTFLSSSNSLFYFLYTNTSAAIHDQIDYMVYLSKGTYTFRSYYRTDTDNGICAFWLDYISQGWIDANAAASTMNLWTIANIVVTSSNLHTVSLHLQGKTGTQYRWEFTHIFLFRTA